MFTTIRSTDHKLHFPEGELAGGKLVRPYECPERWDYICNSLTDAGHTDFRSPDTLDMSVVQQIHTAPYLHFLEHAWSEWQKEGCLLYTSPSPRDGLLSRMPSSA